MSDSRRVARSVGHLWHGRRFVDGLSSVEGVWVADVWQELGEDVEEQLSAVADLEVGCDVSAHLVLSTRCRRGA